MEHRTFDPAQPPDWLDPEHWRGTPNCNHLDSANGVHVARLQAAAELAASVAKHHDLQVIIDLGAGDGGLLSLLPSALAAEQHSAAYWGYELIEDSVRHARDVRRVPVLNANVQAEYDGIMWGGGAGGRPVGNVVVMTEMLEHLADPHGWLARVRYKAEYVIASSPRHETPENHEWNHAWVWDYDGYAKLFENAGYQILDHSSVEWSQLIVAKSWPEWQGNSDAAEVVP